MKNKGLLNPEMLDAVASLGHTEYLVICDVGLPIPDKVKRIDVSIVQGTPSLQAVLKAVESELVVESYIIASEIEEKNPACLSAIEATLKDIPRAKVTHEEFKRLTKTARYIMRTGEASPYANVILVGGVNF